MDKPISVGDLAVIVKMTSCCAKGEVGYINRVVEVTPPRIGRCARCGHISAGVDVIWPDGETTSLYRLKRIPPIGELEGEKREETVNA